MADNKNLSIGALWIKESATNRFFTGSIEIKGEKINIVVFTNNYKQGNQPDYKIFRAREKAPEKVEPIEQQEEKPLEFTEEEPF